MRSSWPIHIPAERDLGQTVHLRINMAIHGDTWRYMDIWHVKVAKFEFMSDEFGYNAVIE